MTKSRKKQNQCCTLEPQHQKELMNIPCTSLVPPQDLAQTGYCIDFTQNLPKKQVVEEPDFNNQ